MPPPLDPILPKIIRDVRNTMPRAISKAIDNSTQVPDLGIVVSSRLRCYCRIWPCEAIEVGNTIYHNSVPSWYALQSYSDGQHNISLSSRATIWMVQLFLIRHWPRVRGRISREIRVLLGYVFSCRADRPRIQIIKSEPFNCFLSQNQISAVNC
jgi:hypothetical protein